MSEVIIDANIQTGVEIEVASEEGPMRSQSIITQLLNITTKSKQLLERLLNHYIYIQQHKSCKTEQRPLQNKLKKYWGVLWVDSLHLMSFGFGTVFHGGP